MPPMIEQSFMKALFHGVIAEDMIFPYPELPSDDRENTSMILDTAEQAFRGAGLVLPLQTGSALIGARVLSADSKESTDQRDKLTSLANTLAEELAGRATAHAGVHVNISMHVDKDAIKDSAEAPGGKEIIGGDLLSIATWAPQENVSGVHFTAAAKG